ncbi:hypothetical protein SAMN04488107_3222 [Geodermatophilus saharensis]|uniref:Uncharacterized protein n=1 Tax=Geodermatophilus saharensis TaxID=1137994 RepID=A0A239G0T2_9ACTN|nr:hypothetical protein [Geodermatophilus saharensis]SNS62595.1 hypothetical protein SAMN04488107_3222 [Geodermatophilus saharensis]
MSLTRTTAATAGTGSRTRGRHRVERAGGIRVADLPAVRERLAREVAPARRSFWSWLLDAAPAGRHTWQSLAAAGGRPRSAFAIILSL